MGYKDGDKLFPNKELPSDFSAFVIKIFTKNTFKHVTATDLRSIYLTDYYNSGQKTEEEYNRTADMMAHSRKQQGQYRKIIKDDNPDFSDSSTITSVTCSSIPSTTITSVLSVPSSSTFIPSLASSTITSSTSVIHMPKDQFKEFINKLCDNMYDNLYGQLYNNIKSEILASLPKNKSIIKTKTKNTKEIQLNSQIENHTDDELDDD